MAESDKPRTNVSLPEVLPAQRAQKNSGAETSERERSLEELGGELNLRIETFLSLKSANTQRTYRGILEEWCTFLKGSGSDNELTHRFIDATDLDAIRYRKWLENRPGQKPRIGSPTSSSTGRALVARSEKMAKSNTSGQTRDGTQLTLANATIAKKFAALRRIYRMLHSHNLVSDNPFGTDKVPPPKAKSGQKRPTEMIPFEKVQEIIALPNTKTTKGIRDKALLSLLFGAGLRRAEAVNVRLADVKRSQQGTSYIRLRSTKAGNDAEQSLPEWAAESIHALVEARKEKGAESGDYLFISYRGRGGAVETDIQLSTSGVYKMFRSYCKKAGVTGNVSPHSARATAITKLLEDGISHREVQEFSRHASVQMVEAYDKRRLGIEKNPAKGLSYGEDKSTSEKAPE